MKWWLQCVLKKKSDKLEFKIQQGLTKSSNGIILINRYIEVEGTLGRRSVKLPAKHMRSMWTHLHTTGQYELIMQSSLQCLPWSCNGTWTHLGSSSLSASPSDVLHVPLVVDCETMCHSEILLILRRCQSRKEVRDVLLWCSREVWGNMTSLDFHSLKF